MPRTVQFPAWPSTQAAVSPAARGCARRNSSTSSPTRLPPRFGAQEVVEVRGDALAQQAAAAQRRDDEALHRTEAPALRQVARQLLALAAARR